MIRIRSVLIATTSVAAIALSACNSPNEKALHAFAADLQKAVDSVRQGGDPGILTLQYDAWQAAVAILPPHGSASTLGLPEGLARDLEQSVSKSESGKLFLIREGRMVAEEKLDPALEVSAGYSHRPMINFKIGRSKNTAHPVEVKMLEEALPVS